MAQVLLFILRSALNSGVRTGLDSIAIKTNTHKKLGSHDDDAHSEGLYTVGSGAYTWRSDVTLDRPYYYTDGHLYLTNEVNMPDVFDYIVRGGYNKRGMVADFHFWQQRTEGGGDIRRQDMPFVSNRMNFSKLGGMVMHPLPNLRDLCFQFAYDYTIDGRNVGQSSTFMIGLMYRHQFPR